MNVSAIYSSLIRTLISRMDLRPVPLKPYTHTVSCMFQINRNISKFEKISLGIG